MFFVLRGRPVLRTGHREEQLAPGDFVFCPEGRAGLLVADRAAVGLPVVVTENVPAVPTAKVVPVALVIIGAAVAGFTVSVKLCVAFGLTPLFAVIVIG